MVAGSIPARHTTKKKAGSEPAVNRLKDQGASSTDG